VSERILFSHVTRKISHQKKEKEGKKKIPRLGSKEGRGRSHLNLSFAQQGEVCQHEAIEVLIVLRGD